MQVDNMNDEEKSVLLAKAMAPEDGVFDHTLNLYDPANMALAWGVAGFAMEQTSAWNAPGGYAMAYDFQEWWVCEIEPGLPDAQRLWLDKVLSLAIEAGLVEVEHAD